MFARQIVFLENKSYFQYFSTNTEKSSTSFETKHNLRNVDDKIPHEMIIFS